MSFSALPPTGAILAAGGIGSRLGASTPKQFLSLAGAPILVHSCRALLRLAAIRLLVVVSPELYLAETKQILAKHLNAAEFGRLCHRAGGATRQDSVAAGLAALPSSLPLVLIHDAARPLVDLATLIRCLETAMAHGAAIAATPVHDTLKHADQQGIISKTIDRSQLWRAQTPQVIRRELLDAAFSLAREKQFIGTDEAALLEHAGIAARVVAGAERNFKITRPEDLDLAEALLGKKERAMKIGHGFDAHRLVSGRKLILGGAHIPFELGLDGHSDADVVAHALTDAILGALGLGDIGRHFPDSDPRYQGMNSLLLLETIWRLAEQGGWTLGNADVTIICQHPRLAAYLPQMQENLARVCGARTDCVNIKATTTEKMGYAGRGEGIAAHAVVLLKERPHAD